MSVTATVDVLLMDEHGKLLLIKRKNEPHIHKWALPGGRIAPVDYSLQTAACRELYEETNILLPCKSLKQYETIGNRTRDPRGFTVTTVFYVQVSYEQVSHRIVAGDDALQAEWFHILDLPEEMAFDHKKIISNAIRDGLFILKRLADSFSDELTI